MLPVASYPAYTAILLVPMSGYRHQAGCLVMPTITSLELRVGHYMRSTGLNSNIVTLALEGFCFLKVRFEINAYN